MISSGGRSKELRRGSIDVFASARADAGVFTPSGAREMRRSRAARIPIN
jgi:hypothetical protein